MPYSFGCRRPALSEQDTSSCIPAPQTYPERPPCHPFQISKQKKSVDNYYISIILPGPRSQRGLNALKCILWLFLAHIFIYFTFWNVCFISVNNIFHSYFPSFVKFDQLLGEPPARHLIEFGLIFPPKWRADGSLPKCMPMCQGFSHISGFLHHFVTATGSIRVNTVCSSQNQINSANRYL